MYDALCCKDQTSTLKDALALVSTNLPLFHIYQTFRVSPWLKVSSRITIFSNLPPGWGITPS